MQAVLDDVIKINNNIIIKGYIIDDKAAEFSIVDTRTKERIPCEVLRFKYRNPFSNKDVEKALEAEAAGFSIQIKSEGKHLRLIIKDGDSVKTFPVRITVTYSKPTAYILWGRLLLNFKKVGFSIKKHGLPATIGKIIRYKDRNKVYVKWIEDKELSLEEKQRQRQEKFEYEPLFSIIVPLYETPKNFLSELIISLQDQTYSKWELCFSEGAVGENRIKQDVFELAGNDSRIKYVDNLPGPLGISSNTNQAISIATGDYIVLGDHDDLFTPDALYECVKVLNKKKVDVIYTDEDKTDTANSKYFSPHFKPDFNLGFFRSNNYICHMFVAAKHVVDKVGDFNDEYNGAQDFDFILRCTEVADSVAHIPKVLYHWRFHMDSTAALPESKLYAYEAGRKAVQAHYDRLGIPAKVTMGENYGYYNTTFPVEGDPGIAVIHTNKNMSPAKINELAKEAAGDYLVFLDENLESEDESWKTHMLGHCQHDDVGAVGARIHYKDKRLHHAGYILGLFGAYGAAFYNQKDVTTYNCKSMYLSDYTGVSGLCLMTKKEIFLSLGGFDEGFKYQGYDMDYCLRLWDIGKRVVYQPAATLIIEDKYGEELNKINSEDREYFIKKWKDKIKEGDPYFNPNLSYSHSDYRVVI